MPSAEAALARLCDPVAKVSAHYLIDEDGSVVALVEEPSRAWHAGVSSWQGQAGLNDRSVGIELINPGHEWGYRPFAEPQYAACIALCQALLARWPIPPQRVLGHSDVAPLRKQDPGELFDWRRLAAAGIGFWPVPGAGQPRSVGRLQEELARIGYAVPRHGHLEAATRCAITAFQRHYRPDWIDGEPDPATLAQLDGLLALLTDAGGAPAQD